MEEIKFPNGFESWQETHFEIVSFINNLLKSEPIHNLLQEIVKNEGTGGFYNLAKDLTDEFELKHQDYFFDGDFFDIIDEFLNEKFK